ncbi:MAG: WG repeat-containing protein [Rikenellaceae bacterium]
MPYKVEFREEYIEYSSFALGDRPIHASSLRLRTRVKGERVEYLLHKNMKRGECFVVPLTSDVVRNECRVVELLSRCNSSLFGFAHLRECRIDISALRNDPIITPILVVDLVVGELLSDYLSGTNASGANVSVEVLLSSIDLLEDTLAQYDIMFDELSPESIIVGLDGRLYPFQYDEVQSPRAAECDDCEVLRRRVVEQLGLQDDEPYMLDYMEPYPPRELAPGEYLYRGYPVDDRSLVRCQSGRWGYLDGQARVVVEPTYVEAQNFVNGFATVCSDLGWGVIDPSGNEVILAIYEDIACDNSDNSDICAVRNNDQWAYFTRRGEQLTEFSADYPNLQLSREQISKLPSAHPYTLPSTC